MTLKLSPNENPKNSILFIGFNQNKEIDFSDQRGVGFVEMLFRTSFVGLLGGGKRPMMPPTKFSLWEGDVRKFILEMNFKSEIKSVRLKNDSINVYTFCEKPELLYTADTFENPLGIVAVCQAKTNPIVVHPSLTEGAVIIAHVVQSSSTRHSNPQDRPPPRCIAAHENPLVALSLNEPGSLLATASSRGTLIRIFDTKTCEIVYFLRRGSYLALITSISFNCTSNLICACSDHSTIHIFDLENSRSKTDSPRKDSDTIGCGSSTTTCLGIQNHPNSPQSSKSFMLSASNFLPKYLNSAKIITSCVRIRLDHSYKSICAFSPIDKNSIIVLSANGSYTKYIFSLTSSNSNRLINVNFLDYKDDTDI